MGDDEYFRETTTRECVLSLSLSLSLESGETEQSAQNVMIFSPTKKKKEAKRQTKFFQRHKKNVKMCCFFASFAVPLTTI